MSRVAGGSRWRRRGEVGRPVLAADAPVAAAHRYQTGDDLIGLTLDIGITTPKSADESRALCSNPLESRRTSSWILDLTGCHPFYATARTNHDYNVW